MKFNSDTFFTDQLLTTLKSLIELHHSLYPHPPQGIFFESLVERAFIRSGWPADQVILTTTNAPKHDLLVGNIRASLKTETGKGTKLNQVNITKLCTTETGAWNSDALIQHTMNHLSRYDFMLMLRAVWQSRSIHYQLIEIPLEVLRFIASLTVLPVGKRQGRRSMAADVYQQGDKIFRVHFDGADGKCQIHRLQIQHCRILLEWEQPLEK